MDSGQGEHAHGHRRYIWFAVALGSVILAFAAISITVVAMTSGR